MYVCLSSSTFRSILNYKSANCWGLSIPHLMVLTISTHDSHAQSSLPCFLFFVAFGCYEFVNPSSAVLLTDTRNCPQQCFQEREISVPHNTGESLCFVMWEKLEYLDNDQWNQLSFRDEIFIINKRNTKTFLQVRKLEMLQFFPFCFKRNNHIYIK